jgi:transcriptional regulator with XRE-family HTH domain
MDLLKQVGLNVRKLRLGRELSQEALALEADLAMNYLSGIEHGTRNPSVRVLGRLASVLGAQAGDFFAPVSSRDVLMQTLKPGRRPRHVVRQKKPSVKRARK